MALEVTLESVVGALVALLLLGGLAWAWWRTARQDSGWRRVAGYVGSGGMGLMAVCVPVLVAGAPLVVVGGLLAVSMAALVGASAAESIMNVIDRETERARLMSEGAPVIERRLSPFAAGVAVFVLIALVGGMVTGVFSVLWKALIETPQTGSALLYQEQLAVAVGSLTFAATWVTSWVAMIGGAIAGLVQWQRVKWAKSRLALAEKRFEARLERERLEAVAAVPPSASEGAGHE